jgi:thiamine-phosphate pyrophosphorylase
VVSVRALRLCVVVPGRLDLADDPLQQVDVALASGATAIRLSLPGTATVGVVSRGAPVAERAHERGVAFFVEDDTPAAVALGADGLHLTRAVADLREAQRAAGRTMALVVSVRSVLEAVQAAADGAEYLEAGPVFSGPDPIGLAEFTAICASVDQPVVAAGGMVPERVADVVRAGAVGVVAGDEVILADDMELACLRLRAAVDQALSLRV